MSKKQVKQKPRKSLTVRRTVAREPYPSPLYNEYPPKEPSVNRSSGPVARFGGGLPAAWFRINQVVATPATVCESKQAKIVGVEWGPSHGRARTDCSGWLYWLVEVGQLGEAWAAGESELLKWKW